jgi:tRNA A-37 threonylcarbamoyl transferase component Bud32
MQVIDTDGKYYTALLERGDATVEEQRHLRKDYEFGISLNGIKGLAMVHDWQGGVILEHLEHVPAQGAMPIEEFLKLAVHISKAVATLHRRNISHNDISPK